MPPNLQEVKLKFARRRSAKVMGTLAEAHKNEVTGEDEPPNEGDEVQGILVTHNFHSKIVSPDDLSTYTPLRVGIINSKLHVPFAGTVETIRLFLNEMFAGVTEETIENGDNDDEASPVMTTFNLHSEDVRRTHICLCEGLTWLPYQITVNSPKLFPYAYDLKF